jgi:osmotically-inducible protein OsmY
MKFVVMKRLALALGAAALLSSALTACVPLVLGGAVAGGSLLASDRRTSGTQLEDEGIELRALSRIRASVGDRAHVNLTSYNRQVLLTGEVPSAQDKQLVEQIASRVENVNSVVNELVVASSSSLADRSSDTLITGRARAMLIDARDLHFNAFKVVTERGTTYLMGRVTQREADRATAVVRATPGVQKVVRIFETISEEELARVPGKPQAQQQSQQQQQLEQQQAQPAAALRPASD